MSTRQEIDGVKDSLERLDHFLNGNIKKVHDSKRGIEYEIRLRQEDYERAVKTREFLLDKLAVLEGLQRGTKRRPMFGVLAALELEDVSL